MPRPKPKANPWAVSLYVSQENRETFAEARKLAAERGLSFSAAVFEGLRMWLKKEGKR